MSIRALLIHTTGLLGVQSCNRSRLLGDSHDALSVSSGVAFFTHYVFMHLFTFNHESLLITGCLPHCVLVLPPQPGSAWSRAVKGSFFLPTVPWMLTLHMQSFFRSSSHLTEQAYFNFAKFLFMWQFWFWVLPNSWKWVREMKSQKQSLKLPAVFQENPKTLSKANSTTLYVRGRSISYVLIQQEMCFGSLSNACYTLHNPRKLPDAAGDPVITWNHNLISFTLLGTTI